MLESWKLQKIEKYLNEKSFRSFYSIFLLSVCGFEIFRRKVKWFNSNLFRLFSRIGEVDVRNVTVTFYKDFCSGVEFLF